MIQKACFGAGCFWGVQRDFNKLLVKTEVGYMGGQDMNKINYEMVCTGKTGHAEVVYIEYNDSKVKYEDLLKIFWKIHNPTTLNKQGPDVGNQYRSVIFYFSDEQRKIAEKSLKEEQKKLKSKIVTKIVPAGRFYRAEEYHQNYLEKKGLGSCKI